MRVEVVLAVSIMLLAVSQIGMWFEVRSFMKQQDQDERR